MKIALPTNDGINVEEHFGHSKKFLLCEVDGKQVLSSKELDPPEHVPGSFPKFLHEQGADVIITGGMGQRAVALFEAQDIQVILGASGDIGENISKFMEGELVSNGSSCSHNHDHSHDHEHHHENCSHH
ncbi:NifB/NifX family molybdenum-iron cluster-binding protein [Spirochaeta cellobiosiphila]|uniref:NifB/NifX family molybdenum-iron cluster-binding protein n=1 Tax=Spirochaeta cellobiosiphila TaxID=504483 RepID=UPI0004121CD9|nr:NifB/NifX family molybdenum-iron cluster-binding protein [Spirochaeta cellobiosiphila]